MGADRTTASLFDERVARDYEQWYEHGFGRFAARQEEALLPRQLQGFSGATSLLEVGCGTGHFTRWFAQHGLHVVGLDASPAMLAQARLRNGTRYLLGDARTLPFEHGQFDLVALITTLEFAADPIQALREAMRVARLGLLLGVLNRQSLLDSLRRLRGRHPVGVLAMAHCRECRRADTMCATGGRHTDGASALADRALPWTVPSQGDTAALGRVPGDVRPSRASGKEQGMIITAQVIMAVTFSNACPLPAPSP